MVRHSGCFIPLFMIPIALGCSAEIFINDGDGVTNNGETGDENDAGDDEAENDDDASERAGGFVLFDDRGDGWGNGSLRIHDGDGRFSEHSRSARGSTWVRSRWPARIAPR